MAFDKVEVIVRSGRTGQPASVSLVDYKGGGRPRLQVSFSMEFTAQAKIKASDKFDLLLGSGDDRGSLRLERNASGLLSPKITSKGSAAVFSCGHIERFGDTGQEKQFCAAELIDPHTIEVILPRWALE